MLAAGTTLVLGKGCMDKQQFQALLGRILTALRRSKLADGVIYNDLSSGQ